ncbi:MULTISPECIES: DUF7504 family protein [Haloarcula]|uniref:RecA-superfamily ATPase, KaiC/GvpD/RAD55 family n=1 Tax=Haloarcula pellucida TaxID=1427151 RepID=A0A830GJ49_9EURY|nr:MULTISPECIES: hypothetical protein [Halomicroarcula]MBX0348623.1 hypothetical protein [Halomicroarcula pellucida]MDS0278426.1 hypothetical protein [Halomicroarcula sp. S1AR25-4]GGN92534.1 hypothetical protein GCM10009030_16870 [Halomicroarcula pellucida]
MSLQGDAVYEFENLPLEPVETGTNLLVTGPALGGTRELLLRLLLGGDAVVIITADTSARETLSDFERLGGSAPGERVRVVDCTQDDGDGGEFVSAVGTPADLTGIGIEYAGQYESVYARGYDAVRTGIYTLTPLLVYSDDVRPVFRFINTVSSRIRTADGLGVCAIDPEAHEDRVVGSIAQSFDARIEVRDADAGVDIRVRGLPDQPREWTAVPALR